MRLCFVFHEPTGESPRIGILESYEAPSHFEVNDSRGLITVTRVLERLTNTCDPVDGIVLYEEVVR